MPDFLLELLTEEIPARMQARAAEQLRERFEAGIKGQLPSDSVRTLVTPRRLILLATGLAAQGSAQEEERRGPRADAPAQALEGFLRSTGLARDELEERDTPKGKFLYATIHTPGRSAGEVIAELVPQIVRDFDWPKSMRWGEASASTASPRWVRPLSSIVALLDGEIVPFEAAGIASGRTTRGHRFMAREAIEITSAATYAGQLRAAKVLIDPAERAQIISDGARAAATAAGLTLIEDPGLVAENAGLTEWPVPLLGKFDPAFLDVPREVIQLTMRTNQKYFACTDGQGALAPAFVCVANLEAPDGGATILAGNRKVLAARLSDAKFFWDADRAVTLESRLPKLAEIVFHEKLGTVADKVERVAKLARWLVESGAVPNADADLAEQAARLCKADLVSATVGEFPEVQGITGRYLALAEGLDVAVADAIRDHYKPVGQGDDVPTAPVSVAVSLADKLDTLIGFFGVGELPTGSRDPYALRRQALGSIRLLVENGLRCSLNDVLLLAFNLNLPTATVDADIARRRDAFDWISTVASIQPTSDRSQYALDEFRGEVEAPLNTTAMMDVLDFLADRLKVQQREAGIRPDIIDAVFALGGEDDLVRLLARVRALQVFVDTDDGANLLAGYRRAANILRDEEKRDGRTFELDLGGSLSKYIGETEKNLARLFFPAEDSGAVLIFDEIDELLGREDFTGAMTALARLRGPVDAFFASLMVNDPDPEARARRLGLLAGVRSAMHRIADFSRIEG